MTATASPPILPRARIDSEADSWHALRSVLLVCGVLSSAVYVVANVVAGTSWAGYSFADQTISELSAIDAPSRSIWLALMIPYGLLSVAFAIGLWWSARGARGLRIAAICLMAICVLGPLWPPMHLRGTPSTLTDTMHVVFACVTSVLFLLAIGFAAKALGTWFGLYSYVTLAVLVVFGFATFWLAPAVGRNEPTPWLGVYERVNVGAYMAWTAVLAITLLRRRGTEERAWPSTPA